MKKLISLALVLVLALSISVPAFATNTISDSTNDNIDVTITGSPAETVVSFQVNASFSVTIPATVGLSPEGANGGFAEESATVTVAANNVFEYGHTVTIDVVSANGYELLTEGMDAGNGVDYTVTPADGADDQLTVNTTNALANGSNQLVATLGAKYTAAAQTFTLTFATTDTADYSGVYSDILTFTVAYNQPTP